MEPLKPGQNIDPATESSLAARSTVDPSLPKGQHPPGNSRGNSINGKANKDRRRKESYARLDKFNKLSLAEKLKGLPNPGANRQRAKYEALLQKQNEALVQKQNEAKKQEKKEERTQKAAEKLVKQNRQGKKSTPIKAI